MSPKFDSSELGCNLSYVSSDATILAVDSCGLAKALKCGEAKVEIYSNNIEIKDVAVKVNSKIQIVPEANCRAFNNKVVLASEEACFRVQLKNNAGEVLISHVSPDVQTTNGIICTKKLNRFKIFASNSGSITLNYSELGINVDILITLAN